ncbi:hypothetical protein [uncultured Streptomyces sp.]|uniref:hypothetical protein n=1 Tax=uncultured Streptomyces sp. TaxID=174707 RepID=UPI002620AA99|nr:hypothetical protein [uncultured Streptomyces sp.]
MRAPTPAEPEPEDHGPRPVFGRPSPALLARADRGYARFLDRTGDQDDRDDQAAHRTSSAR